MRLAGPAMDTGTGTWAYDAFHACKRKIGPTRGDNAPFRQDRSQASVADHTGCAQVRLIIGRTWHRPEHQPFDVKIVCYGSLGDRWR